MLTQDQIWKLEGLYAFVINDSPDPFPEKGLCIGKKAEALAYLAIIVHRELSAKAQLFYIEKLRENFERDGGQHYVNSSYLKMIIEMQKTLVKSLPEDEQKYHYLSLLEIHNDKINNR